MAGSSEAGTSRLQRAGEFLQKLVGAIVIAVILIWLGLVWYASSAKASEEEVAALGEPLGALYLELANYLDPDQLGLALTELPDKPPRTAEEFLRDIAGMKPRRPTRLSQTVRVEVYKEGNVEIFMTRDSFESIPYPDREEFVSRIGAAWCERLDSLVFLPSVKIRDIRVGEKLASHSCAMNKLWSEISR